MSVRTIADIDPALAQVEPSNLLRISVVEDAKALVQVRIDVMMGDPSVRNGTNVMDVMNNTKNGGWTLFQTVTLYASFRELPREQSHKEVGNILLHGHLNKSPE